jgi:hypothetical protein
MNRETIERDIGKTSIPYMSSKNSHIKNITDEFIDAALAAKKLELAGLKRRAIKKLEEALKIAGACDKSNFYAIKNMGRLAKEFNSRIREDSGIRYCHAGISL